MLVAGMGIALGLQDVSVIRVGSWLSNALLYVSALTLWMSAVSLKIVFVDRPQSLIASIKAKFFETIPRRRFMEALPILGCLIIFMPAFSAMKSGIPLFNEYVWDAKLIELDRHLHGGDAWKLIQPVVGYPLVTSIISGFYHLWILLIYAGGLFFAFRRQDLVLRQRYFLSYFSIWTINGVLLATWLASVGPCFLEPLVGRSDFAPLMDYLREADRQYPVMVLDVQDTLIAWHQLQDHGLGRGITAMPSMHVSLAFLFFLAVRKLSSLWAWSTGAFVCLILVGSVHLGYHYAIDGYVAIATTALIWKTAGWYSDWRSRQWIGH